MLFRSATTLPQTAGVHLGLLRRLVLKEIADNALDTAMRNGADWVIREGRLPTPKKVLGYVHRAAPDAVARWELDGINQDIAADRAQAVIERALQAANSSGAAIGN